VIDHAKPVWHYDRQGAKQLQVSAAFVKTRAEKSFYFYKSTWSHWHATTEVEVGHQ